MSDHAEAAARYQQFFEALSPETLSRLAELTAPDVRFRDPFNDVQGRERMQAVLAAGLQDTESLAFEFLDRAGHDAVWYYRWRCRFRPRRLGGVAPWLIDGMSEVHFDELGRVALHCDHWDAAGQFYQRLPLLGGLIRLVARRLKVE